MKSIAELQKIRKEALEKVNLRSDRKGTRIVVGMATCGISAGARPVMMALIEEVKKRNVEHVVVTQTGCIGACRLEPMIEVYKEGEEKVTYVDLTAEKARKIIVDHIVNGKVVDEYTIGAYEK
ncbi:NAD(P)-dependent iron-only hydrogenase iron-sulfur protein [Natronincola peptidivorans]|uniref:NAD(P)-dependent iron-only hydrogenase iron-sulfur protein n=1 Tax=Natronincola peptidivorans TaxID=426128 RepID=A0A1I0EPT4_9FIRM|nr:(2Fe-2S) ferredoxin domain-containing protein [Natronincola peptidivorans]SET47461.1 NAD(P)-dependent iron-only hydrogenase iron-sulfur protein [Natronincola peptidivorans]